MSKTWGDHCEYNISILAEQRNEQKIICDQKPTKSISGLGDRGRLVCAEFCEKHHKEVREWIDKTYPA